MIEGLALPFLALAALLGVALDLLLGEPRRWHALVGFGRLADALQRVFNSGRYRCFKGAVAWSLAVLPPVLLANYLLLLLARQSLWAALALHVYLLYFSLGLRSLRDHTLPIAAALASGDVAQARHLTARIVSRDTAQAEAADLAKAGVESLLENGNDAVFGTLFWFVLGGGAGALLFRLANTLDAMWGYRTPQLKDYGCVAARIDDVLNFLPARLTALTYALLGQRSTALHCWRTQARHWPSPNAGPVMASGAGALGVALGGSAIYDGVLETRPLLGCGRGAEGGDIVRAWRLVWLTTLVWLLVLLGCALVL